VIVRTDQESLILITQPDHAALAASMMTVWQDGGLSASPRRDLVLLATRAHDDGWIEEDRHPSVDPTTGAVLDFKALPDAARQGVWPRAVKRLASTPYAAALVAEHAIEVYASLRSRDGWGPFFDTMEQLRDAYLAAAAPYTLDELKSDYWFLRMADLLSLAFCNDWTEPMQFGAYRFQVEGRSLTVSPDPFGGREIPVHVTGRRVPGERYDSGHEVARALASAPVVAITGVVRGAAA